MADHFLQGEILLRISQWEKAGGDTPQSLSLFPLNDNDPPEIQGPQDMDATYL